MPAKVWNREVVSFCPGVGKGKIVSIENIEAQLKMQLNTEKEIKKQSLES